MRKVSTVIRSPFRRAITPCRIAGAPAALSFVTGVPGRHQVSVAIVERETKAPIPEAQVRLGYHRNATDEAGIARFVAPSGSHRLFRLEGGIFDARAGRRRRTGPRPCR